MSQYKLFIINFNYIKNIYLASCIDEVDLSPNLLNCYCLLKALKEIMHYHTFLDCQIIFLIFNK